MQFQEAKDRLKKLAKGEYHTLSYEFTEAREGEFNTFCRIYIHDKDGGKSGMGQTFGQAFDELEEKLEEIPDIEG
jgi:hypothetical protein